MAISDDDMPSDPGVNTPEQRMGAEVMDFLDHLRERYGDDYSLGDIIIVADVMFEEPDGGIANPIEYGASDPRRWVQEALLAEALAAAERENQTRVEVEMDEDEDD